MMKYKVNNFRNLKCYQRLLCLYKKILLEDKYSYDEAKKILEGICNVMRYLAKSTGDELYINSVINDLRNAIRWIEYTIPLLSYEDRMDMVITKKMIYSLKKSVEEKKI